MVRGAIVIGAMLAACISSRPGAENLTPSATDDSSNVYVDAVRGDDAGAGASTSPWRTITHAIATLPSGTIHVAAGTYGAGETFPLRPRSNQVLAGSVVTLGGGVAPTEIVGYGTYAVAEGALAGEIAEAVVFGPGVTGAELNGFSFGAGVRNAILVDGATVSCDADSTTGAQLDTSVQVVNGGHLTLTRGSFIGGTSDLYVTDPSSTVRARGTIFGASSRASIVIGGGAPPAPAGAVDLGTSTEPGTNTIVGGIGTVGLEIVRVSSEILAAGNVWHPSVQGTDATGHYRAALATGVLETRIGNNYASADATSQMQF